MDTYKAIRTLLIEQINSRNAHIDFNQAVQGLTYKQAGIKVEGVPHTIWELIEHIRMVQDDILEFCKNPDYEKLDWPQDYWPETVSPDSAEMLQEAILAVREGLEEMKAMVANPGYDLQAPFEHGDGQTLFREAMLFVDHNAYHIGQIVQIRRQLGSW
ncbi:DinB family protein [Fodinibius sediminis]|uniref:DinB superfamily protein n=1 Tax=Fodinibius sediminis TaxID=1214077 RepID=A0A521BHY9_9BACT|nr:DinB family protein [Fodinibius sediminis]SMO46703.1 DinB superfamily protein [Fodinibius sediminis]